MKKNNYHKYITTNMKNNVTLNVVGAGIAGCLVSIKLSRIKHFKINLYDQHSQILNSKMPWCRLHYGMIYPELSLSNCIKLMHDSLEFAKEFPTAIQNRPTVIAYNKHCIYNTKDLVNKCKLINRYIPNFYQIYTKNDILHFKQTGTFLGTRTNTTFDKFTATFCNMLIDLNSIKYPFVTVAEPGINTNIVKKLIHTKIQNSPNIKLHLNYKVKLAPTTGQVIYTTGSNSTPQINSQLELKSSWIVNSFSKKYFPEIAIIGQRGTDSGMIQITPYKKNQLQLHWMSTKSTIFQSVSQFSHFSPENQNIITLHKIPLNIILDRTNLAINYIQSFLNINLQPYCKALFGCQFIPCNNLEYRNSTFYTNNTNTNIHVALTKAISSVSIATKLTQNLVRYYN